MGGKIMENILFQDSLGSGLQPSHRISLGAGLGLEWGHGQAMAGWPSQAARNSLWPPPTSWTCEAQTFMFHSFIIATGTIMDTKFLSIFI